MAQFQYVGSRSPRSTGTYLFKVRAKNWEIEHGTDPFTVPDDEWIIKALQYHVDAITKEYDYVEVV